jgi:chromosome segregation ATPase
LTISELTVELENLRATHGQLQEDHSILKGDLSQLEERHAKALEKLKGSRTEATEEKDRAQEATRIYSIAKERRKFFKEKFAEMKALLFDTRGQLANVVANYLKQLSYASNV